MSAPSTGGASRDGYGSALMDMLDFDDVVVIEADLKPLWVNGDSILVEKNFIDAITGDHQNLSSSIPVFSDGLKLLQFATSWKESNDNGIWVDLPKQ